MNLKRWIFSKVQKNINKKGLVITGSMKCLNRERDNFILSKPDYIRLSSLELIANEIYQNNVSGNVCELGVYKGEFAQYINSLFKDRQLYLFDTFEGFDIRDTQIDIQENYSTIKRDFSNTSINLVISKMKYPNNCIVKKGYFPDSLDGLEDKFSFVSLDADLYKPIYEGLCYFYPRLSKGGYILVHDYNNEEYLGVKKAVNKFCKDNNINYVPLSDSYGSAVITK